MIVFTRVYPQSETLRPVPQWGRYHNLLHGTNGLTSPVGRDPIADMSYLVVSLSASLSFGGRGVDGKDWVS